MTNTSRAAGDYLERQTREALRAHGWIVVRAAGSHGIADLVALRAGNTPLLVSCKTNGKIGPQERTELVETAQRAGARPICAYRRQRGWVDLAPVLVDRVDEQIETLKVPKRQTSTDDDEQPDPS
jgi:Holliday junction resolvase